MRNENEVASLAAVGASHMGTLEGFPMDSSQEASFQDNQALTGTQASWDIPLRGLGPEGAR